MRASTASIKRTASESVDGGDGTPSKSKSANKRRCSSLSDDDESGDEEIKLEIDDQEDDINTPPCSTPAVPTRSQQPRRAKADIRKVWIDPDTDSSGSEEEEDGSTDDGNVEAPPTPETVHDHEDPVKSTDRREAKETDDCIAVAPSSSPLETF